MQAEAPPFRHRSNIAYRYCPGVILCLSRWEPSTSSASRLFCYIRGPADTRHGHAKAAEREWLKEHGTKLDWMKYKAESGGRSNPATHTPTGDPSLDAVFSSLSIKTSSNQPSTVNSHIWKGRFFLVATCRQLGSATALPAFRGKQRLHTLTFPQRHT